MDKMTEIMTKLIEKSCDGKITWRDTAGKQKFLTMLGETGVAIDHDSATGVYELQIVDNRGRVIESVSADELLLGNLLPGRSSTQETLANLKDLHEVARRSALNIDSTLDEIASHLDAIV